MLFLSLDPCCEIFLFDVDNMLVLSVVMVDLIGVLLISLHSGSPGLILDVSVFDRLLIALV